MQGKSPSTACVFYICHSETLCMIYSQTHEISTLSSPTLSSRPIDSVYLTNSHFPPPLFSEGEGVIRRLSPHEIMKYLSWPYSYTSSIGRIA